MSENKKITVKLEKAGWKVEISCTEDQLQKAIESVLSSLTNSSPIQSVPSLDERAQEGSKKTVRGLIQELWADAWFIDARSLSEVHEEIARRGYHYDRSAVSHSLTDLVKESILTRQGNMRTYAYIQKKPSTTFKSQNQAISSPESQPSLAEEQ
ncbi:MAG: hypothetical protein OK457_03860 [Thaumarchaeota archaeon]|nr:hypothetical protein [Nitrososphaerota archaeon]